MSAVIERMSEANDMLMGGRVFVTGGTGKTGRRVVERLEALGIPVRVGSRSAELPFDWERPEGWAAALQGAAAIYVTYAPDLAAPGAVAAVERLVETAKAAGVERIVLLSGRGEPEAQAAEAVVQASGLTWTIVRCAWFMQNFSENYFVEGIQTGELALPVGDVPEPFVNADDIADVVTAALTQAGHGGQLYELTGPRTLTFEEAVREMAEATGRPIQYTQVDGAVFFGGLRDAGLPAEIVWLLEYLFTTVLDGRNAWLTDGVERALGRPPRDFRDYARATAASGVWDR